MADDLGRRAHAILKQLIDADTKEQAQFVDSACAGDEQLRNRVLSLVSALDATQGFMETPAIKSTDHAAAISDVDIDLKIPGYQIKSIIGRGGMATVYKATQQRPSRHVALKVMKRGLVGTSARRRFEFETEVLARLRHPGIAQIFEAGAWSDSTGTTIPYFAMEYIEDALPLTTFADEQSLNLRERVKIFASVCDAVQHGHQSGVIHRDLKPGNILVDTNGQPKVIDFGIARSTEAGQEIITQHTDLGQLIGTLNYMSPEQCTHSSAELDVRTDVYSLGINLYELLCGKLPFDLSRVALPEAVRRIQNDTAVRPSVIDHSLHGDLEAIILKALAKDPDRRYGSVAELSNDLRRYLRHETIEARPPTALYQIKLFAQRNRTLVVATVVVAITLIVSTAVAVYLAHEATVEARNRSIAEADAVRERDAARWQGYIATIAAAQGAYEIGEFHRMRTRLNSAPEEHRGWEWNFLNGLANPSLDTIAAHDDMIMCMASDKNATVLATGSADGSVRIWNAQSKQLIAQASGHSERVRSIAVSSDGKRVISGSQDSTVRIWDTNSGTHLNIFRGHKEEVVSVTINPDNEIISVSGNKVWKWDAATGNRISELVNVPVGASGALYSRDGNTLCMWGNSGDVWICDGASNEVLFKLDHGNAINVGSFNFDSSMIATGSSNGIVNIWNTSTGELQYTFQGSTNNIRSVAFSKNGKLFASGQGDRAIYLWSLTTGELITILYGHAEVISGLQFIDEDRKLYSSSWDRSLRLWNMEDPEPNMTLRGHEAEVTSTAFSPDGFTIASSSVDGYVRFWDAVQGTLIGKFQAHKATIFEIAYSHDGKQIATAGGDRIVKLWNAVTGAEIATLKGHTNSVWAVAFSPDGNYIVTGSNDRTMKVWDARSGEIIHTITGHAHRLISVAISPDSSQIASGSRDHSVRLWDINTGKLIKKFDGHISDVFAVIFSADGKTLYSGSRDQTVRTWDITSGTCTDIFKEHGQFITCLALSPDGSRLVASSWFREILLWDLATGDEVAAFKGHDDVIRSISFGLNGQKILTGSYDKSVKVWNSASQETRKRQRAEAIDNLQKAESIVADLFRKHSDIEQVADSLEKDDRISAMLLPWARQLVLKRSLAGNSTETH